MKNLVLVHIESLSNILFNQNQSLFHNIDNLRDSCLAYKNFYTTSTSTLMVIGDLLYGSMNKFESSKSLHDLRHQDNNAKSMFDILKESGYKINSIFYPEWSNADKCNLERLIGTVSFKHRELDFYNEIDDCINTNKPFALYVYNGMSGISFLDQKSEKSWTNNWAGGYSNADNLIGYIFSMLKKYKLLDNTIVVLFGDHGDDFWSHAFNNGYCHSIEPYTSLIHTPLFVFNNDIGAQVVPDLISMVDLKDLCLAMLGFYAYLNDNSNINQLYKCNRKYAFARNLYVNQTDFTGNLTKCYAITNGNYNLMVRRAGLEFYFTCFDPTNHCNLLMFYSINKKGKISYKKKYERIENKHFIKVMTQEHIKEIERIFYILKKELQDEVKNIYDSVPEKCNIWKSELDFNKIIKK